ncbi:DUF2214 family protein [Catenovulum sp. 2E275]|uniref:DUF2214 family protein n=1 Tax=Catenovulum sp. 2E275 TaxID=2980497 RepID=UPI0021D1415E|nr:DUF2214 family protein [Catenovulum sp. 2E275]MCU4674666.1 DUF2214 family protein [Catenovulum sp. 2E275]
MLDILVRYAHFIGIIVFSSALVAQHVLLKPEISVAQFKQLKIIDRVYGISALVVLIAGLALLLWVGKPAEFYSKNPVFHIKMTLFVIMAVLSIAPTIFFIKHKITGQESVIKVPKYLIHIVRFESLLLILIPLAAVFMAAGYGLA